jgi:hypothetical protein
VAGCSGCCVVSADTIKGREIFEHGNEYQVLKDCSTSVQAPEYDCETRRTERVHGGYSSDLLNEGFADRR